MGLGTWSGSSLFRAPRAQGTMGKQRASGGFQSAMSCGSVSPIFMRWLETCRDRSRWRHHNIGRSSCQRHHNNNHRQRYRDCRSSNRKWWCIIYHPALIEPGMGQAASHTSNSQHQHQQEFGGMAPPLLIQNSQLVVRCIVHRIRDFMTPH
jgi:hypothetical protein